MIDCLLALVLATPLTAPSMTSVTLEFDQAGVIASSAVDIEGVVHKLGADNARTR